MDLQLQGGRRRPRVTPRSEINVTPFVDVMLVLLIIFMVTAPMIMTGVHVDLPKSQAPSLDNSEELLVISVKENGEIYLQDLLLSPQELLHKLQAVLQAKPKAKILIKGDHKANYGRIVEVFTLLKQSGLQNVALLTESANMPTQNSSKK